MSMICATRALTNTKRIRSVAPGIFGNKKPETILLRPRRMGGRLGARRAESYPPVDQPTPVPVFFATGCTTLNEVTSGAMP